MRTTFLPFGNVPCVFCSFPLCVVVWPVHACAPTCQSHRGLKYSLKFHVILYTDASWLGTWFYGYYIWNSAIVCCVHTALELLHFSSYWAFFQYTEIFAVVSNGVWVSIHDGSIQTELFSMFSVSPPCMCVLLWMQQPSWEQLLLLALILLLFVIGAMIQGALHQAHWCLTAIHLVWSC